jgi:hypothetical protein
VLCKGKDSTLDIEALPEGGTMVTLRWKRDAVMDDAPVAAEGMGQPPTRSTADPGYREPYSQTQQADGIYTYQKGSY